MGGLDLSGSTAQVPNKAWVVIIGAGLAYGYYKRKKATAAAPVATDPNTDPNASIYDASGTGAVGGYVSNSTASPSPDTGAPTNNAQWATAVTNYLIAQNYDPALADSAVRKYLASAQLSITEYALIKVALLKYGPPPEGVSQLPAPAPVTPTSVTPPTQAPGPVTAAPIPPAPAPAPSHVYYTVRPGDSLSRIAARYPQAWITWQSIYNNNRSLIGSNPNMIHPGQNLLIY